jgi:hypothetical protein
MPTPAGRKAAKKAAQRAHEQSTRRSGYQTRRQLLDEGAAAEGDFETASEEETLDETAGQTTPQGVIEVENLGSDEDTTTTPDAANITDPNQATQANAAATVAQLDASSQLPTDNTTQVSHTATVTTNDAPTSATTDAPPPVTTVPVPGPPRHREPTPLTQAEKDLNAEISTQVDAITQMHRDGIIKAPTMLRLIDALLRDPSTATTSNTSSSGAPPSEPGSLNSQSQDQSTSDGNGQSPTENQDVPPTTAGRPPTHGSDSASDSQPNGGTGTTPGTGTNPTPEASTREQGAAPPDAVSALTFAVKQAFGAMDKKGSDRRVIFPKHIPIFTGDETQPEVMVWTHNVTAFKNTCTESEEQFMSALSNQLQLNSLASQWQGLDGYKHTTFEAWKAALIEEFGYTDSEREEIEFELMKMKQQPKQSFRAYARNFAHTAAAMGICYDERTLMARVYKNTLSDYKVYITLDSLRDMKHFREKAKQFEEYEVAKWIRDAGHDTEKYPHVKTVEQYVTTFEAKKSNAREQPVPRPVPAAAVQAVPNSPKSRRGGNKKATPAATANKQPQHSGQHTSGKGSGESKFNYTKATHSAQDSRKLLPVNEDLNKVRSTLPDQCWYGKNRVGYAGNPARERGYDKRKCCRLCGLTGLNEHLCVCCNTANEIVANRKAYKEQMMAERQGTGTDPVPGARQANHSERENANAQGNENGGKPKDA